MKQLVHINEKSIFASYFCKYLPLHINIKVTLLTLGKRAIKLTFTLIHIFKN